MKTLSSNTINAGLRLAFIWAGFGSLTAWSEPPKVLFVSPAAGASDVPLSGAGFFSIHFNQPMDKASVVSALSMTDQEGAGYAGSVMGSWRRQALKWTDEKTLVKDDTFYRKPPGCALAAGQRYTLTLGAEAKNAAGQALGTPFAWSFRTKERTFQDENLSRAVSAAYLKEFQLHIPFPVCQKPKFNGSTMARITHYWTSTAYSGSTAYRLYLFEDGSSSAQKFTVRRPQGTYRVGVVFVDYGDPKLLETVRTRLPVEQEAYNHMLEEFARGRGLSRPIIRFVNTNIFVTPNEASNWHRRDQVAPALERHGYSNEDFDIVLCLDLNTQKSEGGEAGHVGFAHVGWTFPKPIGNASYVRNFHSIFGSAYDHEFGHNFGWEHEWGFGTPTNMELFPITDPALFGWTDTNGDGVPEILSPKPYGSPDLALVPDFSLEPQIDTQTMPSSGKVTFTISVKARGGFSQDVLLSALNPPLPKGTAPGPLRLKISGGGIHGSGRAILNVEADVKTLSPGTYPVVLLGASGTLKHVESVLVKVVAPQ